MQENILDLYQKLIDQENFVEALPVIEEIVSMNENIPTSWFNYGVCLEALRQHQQAAQAFAVAYDLQPEDYGAQYRVFLNLALGDDEETFVSFLQREIVDIPEIAEGLAEDEVFQSMLEKPSVQKILESYLVR